MNIFIQTNMLTLFFRNDYCIYIFMKQSNITIASSYDHENKFHSTYWPSRANIAPLLGIYQMLSDDI